MKQLLLGLGAISLLVFGCTSAPPPDIGSQVVVERVPGSRPEWAHRVPADDGEYKFFVGMKTHASSLENGNTDARQGAVQKVVEYFGGKGKVDYTKARVESGVTDEGMAGNYIEDGFRYLAESIVSGMRENESYYERVKEWRSDGWHHFYNYYVLVSISEAELTRAARQAYTRQAEEARARNDQRAEAFANSLREQLTLDETAP